MNRRAGIRPGVRRTGERGLKQLPEKKRKAGTITEPRPLAEMVAQLACRADVADAGDGALPDGPLKSETDETVFDEVAEGYPEGSDPDGDPSEQGEPTGDPFFDGDGGFVHGGGPRSQADAEMRLRRDAAAYAVEVVIPAMANLGRFSGTTEASRYAVQQFESHLDLLHRLCEHFAKSVTSWEDFFQAESLAVAGRFFPHFTQENVAKKVKRDAAVISKCRETVFVDIPKFGVVSIGDLFDAARDERLIRCAELVRREHASDPSKRQIALVRAMIKECNLHVTERQGNTIFRELINRGLFTWEK